MCGVSVVIDCGLGMDPEVIVARDVRQIKIERPPRVKVSAQDALEKMKGFGERRGRFVAAVRKGKD